MTETFNSMTETLWLYIFDWQKFYIENRGMRL